MKSLVSRQKLTFTESYISKTQKSYMEGVTKIKMMNALIFCYKDRTYSNDTLIIQEKKKLQECWYCNYLCYPHRHYRHK